MTDLAHRYGMPSRTNRVVAGVLVGALVLGAVGFLGWTVVFHSTPEVQSSLTSYDVRSDHEVIGTFEVARRSQTVEAVCQVQALAADHAVVGEATVPVTDGPESQTLQLSVRTERRATSIVSGGCTAPGQLRPR